METEPACVACGTPLTGGLGSVTNRVAALMFTTVHRIEEVTVNPDHSISLTR